MNSTARLLSPMPDDDHGLSPVELNSARLDGELYCLAGSYSPVDLPETSSIRAQSVLCRRSTRLIGELHTAAWIWGADTVEPRVHQLCASSTARSKATFVPGADFREVVIEPTELWVVGGCHVTSPLRTACDIVRSAPEFTAATEHVVRSLLLLADSSAVECAALIEQRKNLPGKKRALTRLSALACRHPVDVVDGINSAYRTQNAV